MTAFDRYRNEIIEAAEYLKNNPDWTPDTRFMYDINTSRPCIAIGLIVEELTDD